MALNIEVPLEMCEYGMQSATTARTSTYQIINMDPGNYDGATYYFEIVAINANTTNAYSVSLRDVTGSTNKVSISVPANTTARTRIRSASWTPTSGNRVYSTYIAATAVASNIIVYEARIVVVQSNATKTRIQIPLLNRNYNDSAAYNAQYVDNRNVASDGQSVSRYFPIFKYVATAFSSVPASGFALESCVASSNASGTASISLYNKTDSTIVATVTRASTTPAVVTTTWSAGASNWHDGDQYEVRHKISSTSYYSRPGNAYLYITLNTLDAYEIYWKISKARTAGTGALINEYQRAQLNPDNYSSENIFFEATGYNNSANNYLHLQDDGTNDSGTGGSNVTDANIAFNSGTKAIQRAATALTLTNGNRYILDIDAAAANLELSAAFVVFKYISITQIGVADSGGGSESTPTILTPVSVEDIEGGDDTAAIKSIVNTTDTNTPSGYYKEYTITGSSAGSINNYVVEITLPYEAGKTNTDFSNIRFYVGTTECSYWIKSKTDSSTATFSVKIPTIPASPDTVTLKLLAGDGTSTTSDGDSTFHFFDDFNSALTNKWEYIQYDFTTSGGNLVSTEMGGDLQSYAFTGLTNFKAETVYNSDSDQVHRFGIGGATGCLFIYAGQPYNILQFIQCGESTEGYTTDCTQNLDTDNKLVLTRYGGTSRIYLNDVLKVTGSSNWYTPDAITVKYHEESYGSHTTLYPYVTLSPYIYPEPSVGSGGSWVGIDSEDVLIIAPVDISDSETTSEYIFAVANSVEETDTTVSFTESELFWKNLVTAADNHVTNVAVVIPITSVDALTNYIIELDLYVTSGTGIDCTNVADSNFDYLQPKDKDWNDLDFAKSVSGNQAVFDIEIPSLPAGVSYIYLVKVDAETSPVTLDDIYLFADDFIGSDGSAPDSGKWSITGSPTIQDNCLKITPNNYVNTYGTATITSSTGLMIRHRHYWSAFGSYGPRLNFNMRTDGTNNYYASIEEGRPGQQDNWHHTGLWCATSNTNQHNWWYTTTWYKFTTRISNSKMYFDLPNSAGTIVKDCDSSGKSNNISFATWDTGNDLRIDYVKVQPFVENIPTVGTSIIFLGNEVISKWFGTRDSGTVSEDVIGGEETTPVNVSDSGSDSELLAASIYALISQSSSGAETTSLKNTLRTKENPNLCYLNVATAGATNNNVDGFFYWHYNEGEDEYELLPLGTRDLTTLYDGMGTIKSIGFEFFTDEVFTEMHLKVSKEDYIVTATSGYLTPATGNKEYSITVPFMTDYEPQEPYPYLYLRVSVAFYDDVLDFLDWEYKMVSITPEVWKECILNFVTPPDTEFLYFEYKLIVSDSDSEEN